MAGKFLKLQTLDFSLTIILALISNERERASCQELSSTPPKCDLVNYTLILKLLLMFSYVGNFSISRL